MSLLEQLTDRYNRVARLMPALLVSLPASVLVLTAIPAVLGWWSKAAVLLVASGIPFAVSQVVRDRGRRVEQRLFDSWGGTPTTVLLRWSAHVTKSGVRRRHSLVRQHLDVELPDEVAERASPAEADAEYVVATAALRERTRESSRFPLVYNELLAYGFRRNTYGCRPLGLATCLVAASLTLVLPRLNLLSLGWKQQALLLAFDIAWAVAWLYFATVRWVRGAAESYAHQLFASLEAFDAGRDESTDATQ